MIILRNINIKVKPLLFQVIHTLAVIQDNYPDFRHNKLDSNNIYVYLKVKMMMLMNIN